MRKRFLIVAVIAGGLLAGPWAQPGRASWVSAHCYVWSHLEGGLKRMDARTYAGYAAHEGYEWGGGCWNNNDVDDTPGAPQSSGEGPDCSGLVFKAWELLQDYGADGFRWYSRWMNVHGPYTAAAFHNAGGSGPFRLLADKSRITTLYMDAFASLGHVGLIWSNSIPSGGGDYIIEAYNDAQGTDVNVEDYRADTSFRAVRRKQWTADCAPRCGTDLARTAIVS
jgi:hypothetical protein